MAGTLLKQLSNIAQADNTTLTPANSGVTSIAVGAGNTAVFSSAAAMGQPAGYRFTQGAEGNQITSYFDFDADVPVLSLRVPFRVSATPSASLTFLRGYTNTAHSVISWSVQLTTTMRINFGEQGGSTTTTGSATSERLVAGTEYVLQILIDTQTQTFSLATYVQGSRDPINSISGSLTTQMAAQRSVRLGINTNSSLVGGYIDTNSAFALGSGGLLTRHDVSNASPTVSVSADQTTLYPGDTAALTASASDTDGTITQLEWSTTHGTLVGTGDTRTITAPSVPGDQVVVVTVTATDNGGATTSSSVELLFKAAPSESILRQLSSTALADGTAITALNSNFSSVSIGADNSAVFATAATMGQPAGYRFTQGATGNQITNYMDLSNPVEILALRIPFRISAVPSSSLTFLRGYTDLAHSVISWSIQLTTTMRINFGEQGGATTSTGSTTPERLVVGTDYVFQILINTQTQTFSLETYVRGAQTPINSMSGALTTAMAAQRSIRFGINTTSGLVGGHIDTNSAFALGSGELLPRHDIGNFDPTLSLSATKTVLHPGESTVITATAADSDGTIESLAWSTSYGTLTGSGTSRTITAPPLLNDLTVTVSVLATDDDGATTVRFLVLTFKASMHKLYTTNGWVPILVRIKD